MTETDFILLVLFSICSVKILNYGLNKIPMTGPRIIISLAYNVFMGIAYLDIIKQRKPILLEIDPSRTDYYLAILFTSAAMVIFHCWAFRPEG
ncbi:hypothetical protein D3C80_1738410 [compost metagenome]